jgi:methylmalonyl-CoA epimerase
MTWKRYLLRKWKRRFDETPLRKTGCSQKTSTTDEEKGMITKINHIGIAVQNLEEAIVRYQKLGFAVDKVEDLPDYACKIAFLPCGESLIELIEPYAQGHPEGLHHICYEVDDIEQAFQAIGTALPIRDPAPKPGAGNTKVFFAEPASLCNVETEFAEMPKPAHP